jgi:hypothetical protein
MKKDLAILYKLATRSRPERFMQTLNSIMDNTSSDNYLILVSIDDDDASMQHWIDDKYIKTGMPNYNTIIISGKSLNKIDAINRDMKTASQMLEWDILVNISDDMLITSSEFDAVVRGAFSETTDLFLHLPDGYANKALATMSIMGRDYYNRFQYIYHPSYESVYCDNEAMEVAKMLSKYVYVDKHVFQHIHPANVGAHLMDEQYKRTEASDVHARDCINYQNRKQLQFP